MKRILLIAILGFSVKLNSQTQAYLDINNLKALILNRNDMFWDINGNTNAAYEVPKGSGRQCNFLTSLWMGGYDAGMKNKIIELALYPNPANDEVKIDPSVDLKNVEINVFTSLGRLVLTKKNRECL